MAVHGNNKSSEEINNPTIKLTQELQEAYTKAGEEMGKQMAISIIAIVSEAVSGKGCPSIMVWDAENAPPQLKELIKEKERVSHIVLVSKQYDRIPFFLTRVTWLWKTELSSGHVLIGL